MLDLVGDRFGCSTCTYRADQALQYSCSGGNDHWHWGVPRVTFIGCWLWLASKQ